MEQTTLSKTAEMAENLAAAVILNQALRDIEYMELLSEQREAVNHLATVILMAYPPAEA